MRVSPEDLRLRRAGFAPAAGGGAAALRKTAAFSTIGALPPQQAAPPGYLEDKGKRGAAYG